MKRSRKYRKRKRLNAGPIAARLRKIRNHFGYRQYEMADVLNLTSSAYGKNERGYHVIDTSTLATIHDKLGVSAEWLLFNRGAMFWKADEEQKQIKRAPQKELSFTDEAGEMINMMKHIPFMRHTIMGYYQKVKIENADLIRQYLEQEEKTG